MSLCVFWDSIYELCQESVHREGVDPNSMEGVRDLNHIGVEQLICRSVLKISNLVSLIYLANLFYITYLLIL